MSTPGCRSLRLRDRCHEDRLSATGLFAHVKRYDGRPDAEYPATGRLERFEEIDYDGGVKVEVAMSAQMIKVDTGATVWTKTVTKVGKVEKRDVSAVVSAMSNTMDRALQELLTPFPAEKSRIAALKRNLHGVRLNYFAAPRRGSNESKHLRRIQMATIAEKETIKTLTTHYIGGEFVESHGRDVMDIIKSTNGKTLIARVTLGDEQDTQRAISAAKGAFVTYGRSAKEERLHHLRQLHKAVSARVDDLTAVMIEEYGGVARFARLIVESGIGAFAAAEKALRDMRMKESSGTVMSPMEPVGVAGLITAWNANALFICLKLALGYRGGLHRRSKAERDERAGKPERWST